MPHSMQGLGAYNRDQKKEKLAVKTDGDYVVVLPCTITITSCLHRQAQKQKTFSI